MWIGNMYPDAATTSLHIISRSGFGVKLRWPGEEQVDGELEDGYEKFSSHQAMGKHTMTFEESLHTMLRDVIWMGVFSLSTLSTSLNEAAIEIFPMLTTVNQRNCPLEEPK